MPDEISAPISPIMPREAIEQRWKADDQRFVFMDKRLDLVGQEITLLSIKLDKIYEARIPTWFILALAPFAAIILEHFLPTVIATVK